MKMSLCNKPQKLIFAIIAGIFLMSCGVSIAAEFSADMIVQPTGEEKMTGKFFIKGDKVREETAEEGEKQVMIIRTDKKVTWLVMPDEKMYMEIPWQEDDSVGEWTAEKEKGSKAVGEETVNGYASKKFERMEDGQKVTYWIAKKLSFPIKIEYPDAVIEYKNIKEGSVQDSQFEIPAGFDKAPMPAIPDDKEEQPAPAPKQKQ